jgi:fatty-acyl-CoA synthase
MTALDNRGASRRQTSYEILARSAAGAPSAPALRFGPRDYTYGDLRDAVERLGAGLSARGVRPGDRVAAFGRNSDWYAITWLATQAIGAVHVPVNFTLNARELGHILTDSQAGWVVADADLLDTAARAAGSLNLVVAVFEGTAGAFSIAELAGSTPAPGELPPPDATDLAQIAYTSGTESLPKGVMLTASGLTAQYVSCIVAGRYEPGDVAIHALPLYHCAQMHCFLMPYLYIGARNVILPGPKPTDVLDAVEAHQATAFFAAPTVWISLLRHPDFAVERLASLRKGYYGASIMPVEVVRELRAVLPDLQLWNYYGQTELGPLATCLQPEDQLRKPGSAGRPVLNVRTRIVDDDNRDVAPGEVGEIVHRSPQVTAGYWGKSDEEMAETFRDGWFHSGDLGVLDEDGFLTIVDRKKDMINSGGENISSREVEEILYEFPGVAEAAVVGLPHPRWIESVVAIVVARPGAVLDEDELAEFARQRLAPYKTPRKVVLAPTLPRSASGKILKRELRETFARMFVL